jgi:hypothetical protein
MSTGGRWDDSVCLYKRQTTDGTRAACLYLLLAAFRRETSLFCVP